MIMLFDHDPYARHQGYGAPGTHMPYKRVISLPSRILHSNEKIDSLKKIRKNGGGRKMAMAYQPKALALKPNN